MLAYGKAQQRWEGVIVASLLLLFIVNATFSIYHKSFTYDETAHFRYGRQLLDLESDRFDDSKMPFSVINALVYKLAVSIFPRQVENIWQAERLGRLATIAFSVLVGFIVYLWAREWGRFAGLTALFLYVFEPTILAHSRLVTTDIYIMGMVMASVFTYWRFLQQPGWKRGVLAAVVLGLAQLAKYTSVFLFPLLLVLTVIHQLPIFLSLARDERKHSLRNRILKDLAIGLGFVLVALLIINIGFLFNRTFLPFGEYDFRSSLFQSIQANAGLLNAVPVPTPYPYLEGLDWIVHRERTGEGYGRIYLLGELRPHGEGFPGYFLVAMLFKLPVGLLLLTILAIVVYTRNASWEAFRERDMFLFLPWLMFTVYFNFFFRAQIGIRFILPSFPFMLVFCGRIAESWRHMRLDLRVGFVVLLISIVPSVLSYYPHYLSYFNAFVRDRTRAYRLLADSNLDWGQNKALVRSFLEAHPDYIFEPLEPTVGTIVVEVNKVVGVREGPELYAWLRECDEPVGHFAYSYLIFEFSQADLENVPFCTEP